MPVVFLFLAQAQASTPGLGLAYLGRQHRDLHASPLRYAGHTPALRLELTGTHWSSSLDLGAVHWHPAGIGQRTFVFDFNDPVDGEPTTGQARTPAWSPTGHWVVQGAWDLGPVALGPRLATTAHYATLSQATWALFQSSVDLRLLAERGAWQLGLWAPLGALHTRMPYGLDPLQQGRTQAASFFLSGSTLQSWGRRQAVGGELSWRGHAGQRDLTLRASAAWSHSAVPDHLYALDTALSLTVWRQP